MRPARVATAFRLNKRFLTIRDAKTVTSQPSRKQPLRRQWKRHVEESRVEMSGSAADVVDYDPIQFYEDPYPIYRHLRDDAPVYHNRARGVWVLSRYDDIQTAARDWRTLVNGRGVDVFA